MKKQFISKGMGYPLLFALVWNMIAFSGTRLINTSFYHYSMVLPLDKLIPLIPWTISIYVLSYLFWGANYIMGAWQNKEEAYRFLGAQFLAKTICLLIFLLIPTICVRPEVTESGFWNDAIRFLYSIDTPDNLFPSVHCLEAAFSFIAVRKNPAVPKWYRVFSFFFAIAICVSTLTTRQHLLVDVFAGVTLAEASYYLSKKTGFGKFYQSVWEKILGKQ